MRNNTTARSCSSSKRRLSCAWGALASRTDSSSGAPPSPAKGEQGPCDKENAPNNVAVVSFLEENDDAAEKRRARLKSLSRTSSVFNNINSPVATRRRVSIARRRSGAAPRSSEQRTHLSGTQLRELYSNCIKLSAENKITQKNSWALNLIDHIDDVLQTQHQSAETESGVANFQAASCTLDASVKIYSCRVDSIHNEAYRVLGGLSRTAKERDTDSAGNGHEDGDGPDATAGQGNGPKRRKKSKANTLETNPEALQLKTFDLEFAVDPLFRKTSASFDEGGARGLLLNHLCVYNLCDLVFDSTDAVLLKADSSISEDERMNTPVKDPTAPQPYIQSDLSQLSSKQLCPGFEEFRSAFKEHQLPSGKIPSKQSFAEEAHSLLRLEEQLSGRVPPSENQGGAGFFSRAEGSFENTTDIDVANDDDDYDEGFFATEEVPLDHQPHGTSYIDTPTYLQTTASDMAAAVAGDDGIQSLYEDDLQFLASGEPALNWAGPTHWKYRSRTGTTKTNSGNCGFSAGNAHSEQQTKQMLKKPGKASRKRAFMIDFAHAASATNWSQAFARSRAATTLSRAVQERTNEDSTTLPQDLHYDIRSLLHLFCKPNVSVASLRYVTTATSSDNRTSIPNPADATTDGPTLPFMNSGEEVIFESNAVTEAFGSAPASADVDDEDQPAEEFVDDGFQLDESFEASPPGEQKDKGLDLIEAPKQVEKISIRYASVAKKVDVMRLKGALWKEIIPPNKQDKEEDDRSVEPTFQQVLSSLAQKPNNRGLLSDVSVQYCFICLLHLANEKELELNPLVRSTNALLQSDSSSADCGGEEAEEPDSDLADFYSLPPAVDISISGCTHSDSC